jgi:cell division protein FtsQ
MSLFSGSRSLIPDSRMATGLVIILIMLACFFAIQRWLAHKPSSVPIRYVRVEGTFQHLEPVDVKRALLPLVVDTGYFSVAMSPIRDAVEALPWVDSARIRRIWPDTLVVRIDEQRPVARWGDAGLLNERGERFTPEKIEAFQELPLLRGQEGQETELFSMFNKVSSDLAHKGLAVESLTVSERRAWTIRLTDGLLIKMGRQRPWKVLDRFLRAMPLLKEERIRAIESVDLRYPNGFAVTWKPGTEIEWRSEQSSNHYTPRRVAGL